MYTNERPDIAVERCVTRQSTRPNHHLGDAMDRVMATEKNHPHTELFCLGGVSRAYAKILSTYVHATAFLQRTQTILTVHRQC